MITNSIRATVHRGAWSSTTAGEPDFSVSDGTNPNAFTDGGYRLGNIVSHSSAQWLCVVDRDPPAPGDPRITRANAQEPSATNMDWVQIDDSIPTPVLNLNGNMLSVTVGTTSNVITLPSGGGTAPQFGATLSNAFEGFHSYLGSAEATRTVSVSVTNGTFRDLTVSGLTPAPTITSNTFTYTPTTNFAGDNFTVTVNGTQSGQTVNINVRSQYFYPYYYGAFSTAPTDNTGFSSTSTRGWAASQNFRVSNSNTDQMTTENVYVAVHSSVTSPTLTLGSFVSDPIPDSSRPTFTINNLLGDPQTYTIYNFGPIDEGEVFDYTIRT